MTAKNDQLHPALNTDCSDFYEDLYWSSVGPDHERASYNLIYLLDVYQARGKEGFQVSNGYGFVDSHRIADKVCATMPAAKRAGRAWFLTWLADTGAPIEWRVAHTGVHFEAFADGLKIGHYYHNETPGRWHVGFRAHFGMTYFRERVVGTPDSAKEAMAEAWANWLRLARSRFLINPKT